MKRDLIKYCLSLALVLLYACGGGSSGSSSLPSSNTSTSTTSGSSGDSSTIGTPASISLSANPSSLTVSGTSSITATVKDSNGDNVPDGTYVYFSIDNSALGSITTSATTSSGQAIATFTSSTTPGTVTITASTSNSITGTLSMSIAAASGGSIVYYSTSATVLGLAGSGQTETATITFKVYDTTGNSVVDGTSVNFALTGPNGGEYIGDSDGTPTTASGSTVSGSVSVILHSGSVSGPCTITATIAGTSISSSSAVISIGGGTPSASHFSLAASVLNLAGLEVANRQSTISAYIADRFGNYNILTGTSVSFYAEGGAIDRSATTNSSGATSVVLRTQEPMPVNVLPDATETSLVSRLNATYSPTTFTTGTPRDGRVTVLATVQGEEAFSDANGNGVYDYGESFTDLGEPFIDKNGDGCWNSGTTKNCSGTVTASSDPFEEYIDANGNGQYDGPNGVWDGPGCSGTGCQTSKMIWKDIELVFTGNAAYIEADQSTFTLGSGASQSFNVVVGDTNLNRLVSGTTITVSASAGTLTGDTSLTLPDGVPSGPSELSFTLQNAACQSSCANTKAATITITVTPGDSALATQYLPISGIVSID